MIRPGLDVLVPVPCEVADEAYLQAGKNLDWFMFRMELDEIEECQWVRLRGPSRVTWRDAGRMGLIHRAYLRTRPRGAA